MVLEKNREECSMKNVQVYEELSLALKYPAVGFIEQVRRCQKTLEKDYPNSVKDFSLFTEFVISSPPTRLEEEYIKTFDVNAVCHLDVGYQLFGEDYKRGALLVELSRLQRNSGNDTGTELADYLPNLLKMLPKLKDEVERAEIAQKLLLPAIEKMLTSFKEDSPNVFRSTLNAVYSVLVSDFGPSIDFPYQPDYIAEVEEEMHV